MSSAPDEKKKKGPLFWVIAGGGLFLILLFGGLLVVAYSAKWAYQQRTAAGQGGKLFRNMCLGPDSSNEIVDEDAARFTVHFRNKKTGKEFICSMDPTTNRVRILAFESEEPAKASGK